MTDQEFSEANEAISDTLNAMHRSATVSANHLAVADSIVMTGFMLCRILHDLTKEINKLNTQTPQ